MAGKWDLFLIKLQSFLSKVYQHSNLRKSNQKPVTILQALPLMVSIILSSLGQNIPVKAQLIPDKTLGAENSVIKPFDTLNDLIDGGAKRGVNLFHSFQEFNVDAGRGVYFLNPGIENIITRVTGGNSSKIFGILGAYDNANLFLINPNGILFGPNARLALGGSFVASTASGVLFDGFEFGAIDPKEVPLLTANIPIGLRFRDNPGTIRVENSRLEVRPEIQGYVSDAQVRGTTLALVGGNIDLDGGGLIAEVGSQVELGGLTNAGTVGINSDNNGLRLSFPNGVERADISLNNSAFVLTNGVKLEDCCEEGSKVIDSIIDIPVPSRLTINSRNINILNESQLINFGVPLTPPFSLPKADMRINATGSVVVDRSLISNNSGGDISIGARSFSLINGSQLSTQVDATANFAPTNTSNLFDQDVRTGNITLQVDDKMFFSNSSVATSLKTTPPTSELLGPIPPIPPLIDIPFPQPLPRSLPRENRKIPDPSPFTSRIIANIAETTGNIIPPKVVEPETNGRVIVVGGQDINNFPELKTQANAGSVNITAKTLSLTDTAQLFINSETSFNRTAVLGNVNLDVSDAVTINGKNSGVFVSIGNSNQVITAGNINLKSGSLSLTDGAQLQTSIISSAQLEKAGSIDINVSGSVYLNNSRISNVVLNESNVGNITLNANSVSLTQGGRIITNTEKSGNAGNIAVSSNSFIDISGANSNNLTSGLFARTNSTGKGGNITVETPYLRITDNAAIDARTSGQGLSGNILVRANTFEAVNRGQLTTTTSGKESAGNINLYVTDNIKLQGSGSGLFANTAPGSTGKGGNIFVDPRFVLIQNGAGIAVNSQGSGEAGDITLLAGSLTLDGKAFLSAETTNNQGGNINLQIQDLLLLRGGSRISTTAGSQGGPGSGGNINIGSRFLVAVPNEDSDITANSFGGRGGKIDINAQRFGLSTQNQLTNKSDITAFSQLGSSFNGQLVFNTPEVDPGQGLVELPQNVINPEDQIAQNPCQQRTTKKQSEFFNLGRGGLPPSPTQTLNSDTVRVGWVEPDTTSNLSQKEPVNQVETLPTVNQTQTPIMPARGWVRNERGEVILVSSETSNTSPERQGAKISTCPAP